MSRRILIVLSLMACVLAACSDAAPTAGEAKDFATVCDKANDGKRVAVVGYLYFPDSFTGDQSVVLRLYSARDFSGDPIGVTVEFGAQANRLEPVADQYSESDLKVHLADGQLATTVTKVKVSGNVYYPVVSQDFKCGLENPLVELAP